MSRPRDPEGNRGARGRSTRQGPAKQGTSKRETSKRAAPKQTASKQAASKRAAPKQASTRQGQTKQGSSKRQSSRMPDAPAKRGRGRWVLPALLGVVTVVVLLAYFTPLVGVRSVQVSGTTTLDDRAVLAAAQVRQGKPMLQLDIEKIRTRLEKVAKVASAQVTLSWPSEVHLDVTERVPAAFVLAGGGFRLVDASGIPFETVQQPPADLPELRVHTSEAREPAGRSAMAVLRALPPGVLAQTQAVITRAPSDIRLLLEGDRRVQWGSQEKSARKAAILPALLTRPGKVYDVVSPELPTVS